MDIGNIDRLRRAQQQGLGFLYRAQHPDGEIPILLAQDGALESVGVADSTPFATGLAISCLLATGLSPLNTPLIRHGLEFIRAQRLREGVWRYWSRHHPRREEIPPDIDTTSCCTRLLRQTESGSQPIPWLHNRAPDGLFYTWILDENERENGSQYQQLWSKTEAAPDDVDLGVNVNALRLLGNSPATAPIIAAVQIALADAGSTGDKWYRQRGFFLYLCACASAELEGIRNLLEEPIQRALGDSLPNTESAALSHALHSTACNLVDLAPAPHSLALLLDSQREDGSWPASPLYSGGPSGRVNFGSPAMSTAFVLQALAYYCPVKESG